MYNVYAPLQAIEQTEPSIGGYCRLLIVPIQYISSWPVIDPVSGLLDDLPTLLPGKTWFSIATMPGNAVYKEDENESNAGNWYKIQLTAPLADDSTTQSLTVLTYRFNQFAVVMKEQNQITRLIGNSYAGARIIQSYSSADEDGTRQRMLNIIWEHSNPASIITSTVDLTGTEFSDEYSDEFS